MRSCSSLLFLAACGTPAPPETPIDPLDVVNEHRLAYVQTISWRPECNLDGESEPVLRVQLKKGGSMEHRAALPTRTGAVQGLEALSLQAEDGSTQVVPVTVTVHSREGTQLIGAITADLPDGRQLDHRFAVTMSSDEPRCEPLRRNEADIPAIDPTPVEAPTNAPSDGTDTE